MSNEAPSFPTSPDEVLQQWGAPIAQFKPGRGRLGISIFLVALFGLGGVIQVVAWLVNHSGIWLFQAMICFLGSFLANAMLTRLYRLNVVVFPQGLVVYKKGQFEICPWEQITEVQVAEIGASQPGYLSRLLPGRIRQTMFIILRKNRTPFVFDQDQINHLDQLLGLVQKEAQARQIPWQSNRL
ncbi:MAG TPA: DUF6585 family protein [Gemmataceae bacterium]|nr:DUF6585 family protein [Gemmataceae bacterium]